MSSVQSSTVARWLLPAGVVGAIVAAASGVFTAGAGTSLPGKSSAELLSAVQGVHVTGLSGTVVQNASLGLPQLPSAGGPSGAMSPLILLSGSHSVKVWYAGAERQRVAVLDQLGETDYVHNGTDLWKYDSATRTATHTALPADAKGSEPAPAPSTALRPDQVAQQALKALAPTTVASTDRTASVAGRAAYQLVLEPRDRRSLISSVRLAIDGKTFVPLRVQVFAQAHPTSPAFEIFYTHVNFGTPDADQFRFTPPAGAKVKQESTPAPHRPAARPTPSMSARPHTVGQGWTTVVEASGVTLPTAKGTNGDTSTLLRALKPVSGPWGSGRLLTTDLLSVLITDNGHVFAGAVAPSVLYAAAR